MHMSIFFFDLKEALAMFGEAWFLTTLHFGRMLFISRWLNENYPSCVLAFVLIVLVPLLVCVFSFRCMQNTADGPSEHVEDYLCDPEDMPLGSRECKLPCPEDCVISEWGPWTQCALVRLLAFQ